MARDYYETLGVSRDASDDEIKRAFRQRARELHPDVNPDPRAEARFKELAQAYEALSDPETRTVYDRYGADGLRGRAGPDFADFGSFQDLFDAFFEGDVFERRGGPRGGDDIGVAVEMSFVESARDHAGRGVRRAGRVRGLRGLWRRPRRRDRALLDVREPGAGAPALPRAFGQFVRTQTCPQCRGGEQPSEACPACSRPEPYRDRPVALGRHPGGHRERPADPAPRARRRERAKRSGRGPLRGGRRGPGPALRPGGARP